MRTLQADKTQKIEDHAEAMRLADLVINFLAVRAENLRHVNGVEAEVKEIYQRHIDRVQDFMAQDANAYASPTSSSKKQRK